MVVVVVRISNLIMIIQEIGGDHESRETHSCFSRFSSTKSARQSGKKSGERGFDEECQPIREGEEHPRSRHEACLHCKQKEAKISIMEEEVQALVVDNGSGMCKAGE
jgi:hypothetical protein